MIGQKLYIVLDGTLGWDSIVSIFTDADKAEACLAERSEPDDCVIVEKYIEE